MPVPLPSEVWLSLIVGVPDVFQQTPLAVTAEPPSAEILPPEAAEDPVIDETDVVETVGCTD